ncbi:HD-GYP domain-containing protein [Pectinatus haikarae]|uniref:Nucleotidyltransferase with HDIG domain n=1 Tax=Pectinatus haikarae TaxID=349096 RepID=A0ABT9Y5T6_9FIRM|nr:HD domain-containing phosphohydrolase [Pectinatus haikarae]MDQ0202557.1 putative nucleotidyltransferase with HDIG domain [Pectinatus haikarae]
MKIYHGNSLNLMRALSMALELLSVNLSFHHWRVAIIAMAIAEEMKLPYKMSATLLQASLLHDIGAAPNWNTRVKLRSGKNYEEKKIGQRYALHAYDGYACLKNSHYFGELAGIILHHHENWQDTIGKTDVPLQSRILRLADYVEVHIDPKKHILLQVRDITECIKKGNGILFSPEVVQCFLSVSRTENFWLNITDRAYADFFFKKNEAYGMANTYTENDVIDIAETFAAIIDQTSEFTYNHSCSVAKIAVFLAAKKGFSDNELKDMMVAGLLHDIGKLSIPNEVLEKPGKLSDAEFALIHQHTYYTYWILRQIDGFEQIAEWAAYHHECLDGSGYPFHLQAEALTLGSRIMAVADIFVALREDRPYRPGLPQGEILCIIKKMAENFKLDKNLVELLADNYKTATFLVSGSETGIDLRKENII